MINLKKMGKELDEVKLSDFKDTDFKEEFILIAEKIREMRFLIKNDLKPFDRRFRVNKMKATDSVEEEKR